MTDATHDQEPQDAPVEQDDLPEHQKPENLEKLKDYGREQIPPGVA